LVGEATGEHLNSRDLATAKEIAPHKCNSPS
jgi:hypothetical protein